MVRLVGRPRRSMSSPWERFRRGLTDRDYAFLDRSDWPAAQVALSSAIPDGLLYFTKSFLIDVWLDGSTSELPLDFVVRYGLPSIKQCELLRFIARRRGKRFLFVGDLDPLDLTVFKVLQTGSVDWRPNRLVSVPIQYCGIDDRWLASCVRRLASSGGLDRVLIKMPEVERQHLAALEESGLNVADIVGGKCAQLLHDGFKLELEGASNPAIYGPRFPRDIILRLLRTK